MADDYPYMVSNNKINQIVEAIHSATRPPTFSNEFLKKLGFNSSNDRAVIPLFKRLGFLSDSGVPTQYYDDLKDKTKRGKALAQRIRELYADIYAINTEIHTRSEDEIKGAISRVTGKDAVTVGRYYTTFKTIAAMADFSAAPASINEIEKQRGEKLTSVEEFSDDTENKPLSNFHYNIQIHLPPTTDISVYNAIFKSLRDNLII